MCTSCKKTIGQRILGADNPTDNETFVDQLMIDLEENENSGYFPIQIFETQGKPRSVKMSSFVSRSNPPDISSPIKKTS